MPTPLEIIRAFRARFNVGEAAFRLPVVTSYQSALLDLIHEIQRTNLISNAKIAQIRQTGTAGELTIALRNQEAARTELISRIDQINRRLDLVDSATAIRVEGQQARLVGQTGNLVRDMLPAELVGQFGIVPVAAVETAVAVASAGPVANLYTNLGEMGTTLRREIISGLAAGRNPREMARRAQAIMRTRLSRALSIARTETMRAYREASLINMRANSEIIQGWIWISAADHRTCPVCWSMHGTFHRLSQSFASHVNCRCSPVPRTRRTRIQFDSGIDRFDRQSEEVQRRVLGPSAQRAYADGAVVLKDFRGFRVDPVWGPSRFTRSLRSILGRERAQQYIRAGR